MANAFNLKSYYNPYISPTSNSFWGVVSIAANEVQETAQQTVVTLIVDVSGSMQGMKFQNAIATVEDLLQSTPAGLLFSVVVFDTAAYEVVPLTMLEAGRRETLVDTFRRSMKNIKVFGGTSMSMGIRTALDSQSSVETSASQYAIFLSDGQNTEPEHLLAAAVKEAADTHMHLCAYGYGNDWKPDELTKMAQITNGWMPKAVPKAEDLRGEFSALIARMARTVATDVALQLWTPTGARILSLSQAYPDWVRGEAAPVGDDHTWIVPVPPMTASDHRDFIVHIELASVGARVAACKPSIVYAAGGQRIEEKADQSAWFILQQTQDSAQYTQVNPVVAGYLGQGQLAASTRAMTEALAQGDSMTAERHRTEALDIAHTVGNKAMTQILEEAGAGSEIARKTAALGTSTVSLTDM